jgi:3-phosphoshikimate 1-carboxyvinyltransferase
MSLPPVLDVVSLQTPIRAEVTIPGSKSITNRALILAALGKGSTTLEGALWSDDTQVMVECLRKLGFEIVVAPDSREPANRIITVGGRNGEIPAADADLFVGNSGTSARFLAAFVCLGRGVNRLSGVPRMHERPQRALFAALRDLGYRVDSPNDKLPATIYGSGPRPGAKTRVSIVESSQFASALLLAAGKGKWEIAIDGENSEESSYVQMTSELVDTFSQSPTTFQIEPDASSASYFWGADWLLEASEIRIANWSDRSLQVDARFPKFIRPFAPSISRQTDLADSIMTAIVLAPFADAPKTFTDLGRLRVQECERVQALHAELVKCGTAVEERADTLRVNPGRLHGAEIETYGDHRIAMCFGMLGLRVPGMRIKEPSVVEKTFPNFWEKLAALQHRR